MQGYAHLAQEERYHIEALRKEGRSMRSIAAGMGRCHSTVSRELRRNAGQRGYRHQQADRKARERLKAKPKCVRMTPEAAAFVDARLADGWSPEQISGRMKAEGMPAVSHEAIYRRIWLDKANGGGLHRFLRHSHRKRRKRYGKHDFRGRIPCRTDISERPPVVDERSRLGDWEADTVIGKGHRGALVTLAERKTRFMLAASGQAQDQAGDGGRPAAHAFAHCGVGAHHHLRQRAGVQRPCPGGAGAGLRGLLRHALSELRARHERERQRPASAILPQVHAAVRGAAGAGPSRHRQAQQPPAEMPGLPNPQGGVPICYP